MGFSHIMFTKRFFFLKNIFTAASPNTTLDDALLSISLLLRPWVWNKERYIENFKYSFGKYIGYSTVHLIDSWRSGLLVTLKALGIGKGDEVIIPSFTCIVVANAVVWSGSKPIYLDTSKENFNADYNNIKNLISKKTKAIVIQHTFGDIVDIGLIKNILKDLEREDIVLIEDFAHLIYRNMKIDGDIGIFTFGIEKVISSVRGGAIVVNKNSLNPLMKAVRLKKEIKKLPSFGFYQVLKSLLNPIFWTFAIPLHSVGFSRYNLGALIRFFWRRLGFLGIMVEKVENFAIKPKWFPAKMNPALARLGLHQLMKLDKLNEHRIKITKIYNSIIFKNNLESDNNIIRLRYPLLAKDKEQFRQIWNSAKKVGVTLGNWFDKPIYGAYTDNKTYKKLHYSEKETPITLSKTGLTLNLPTSINISEERAKILALEISKILG